MSNLEKIYWPKEKITKADLLKYYIKMAKTILPYLKDRALTMHRFPNGIQGDSFYQKDVVKAPSFVKIATIAHRNRKVHYIVVQNIKTLLYVVNLGSIELHPFHSRIASLERPDYLVLDLDPNSISFDSVIDVALTIHEILSKLKIPHFCKTSGGSGLHILIPTKKKYTYGETKKAARIIAELAHKNLPKTTSLERSPSKRKKKVYIDTLQNSKGQLIVAPYSVRAFAHAPVSTPLSWNELKHGIKPEDYTIDNVPSRVAKKGDILKELLGKASSLKILFSL